MKDQFPEVNATIYLEPPAEKVSYMKYFDEIKRQNFPKSVRQIYASAWTSKERLGKFLPLLEMAKDSLVVDHHITNTRYGIENVVVPKPALPVRVLYDRIMDSSKIRKDTAACLYTGIVHDTGVFQHSNTSGKTMDIAGRLVSHGNLIFRYYYGKFL